MVGVVLMMVNYEVGEVVVLWWLVSGGKSPFECGSSGTNGRSDMMLQGGFGDFRIYSLIRSRG